MSDQIVFIPRPFDVAKSETLSTRTYDRTIVDAEAGVNNTQAVVVAVKYISFLPTARFADVAHPIPTVHVQADWLVTSTIIWYFSQITVTKGADCVYATVEPAVCTHILQFVPVQPLEKVFVASIFSLTQFQNLNSVLAHKI